MRLSVWVLSGSLVLVALRGCDGAAGSSAGKGGGTLTPATAVDINSFAPADSREADPDRQARRRAAAGAA